MSTWAQTILQDACAELIRHKKQNNSNPVQIDQFLTLIPVEHLSLFYKSGYTNSILTFIVINYQVMERALFHMDNAYRIPNIRGTGYICKTNVSSNTAFRGFGGPQVSFN